MRKETHASTLTRQDFLRMSGVSLAGLGMIGLSGCATGGSGQENDPIVVAAAGGTFGDSLSQAYFQPYSENESNNIVLVPEGPVVEKLKGMVENSQVTWDVFEAGAILGTEASPETPDLFQPLDYSVIDRAGLPEEFVEEYRVPYMVLMSVIGFRPDALEAAPQNWADFFDTESFPGKRGYPTDITGLPLEAALLGDGVEEEDLYPLDIDRALAKLDTVRDSLVFWTNGDQARQLIADGEVNMMFAQNGRIQSAIDTGAPVEIQWNQGLVTYDTFTVPKGAPNADKAMELIAYIVSENNNYRISEYISYGPANQNSFEQIDPEIKDTLPNYRDRMENGVVSQPSYYATNLEEATARYNQWLRA